MKLMMIDGNSMVNRAFYGIRMLNAPDGTPTNAVYGFLTILGRLLDEEKPEGICVAFDLKAPTFRHLQYEGYKAQRKPMPEDLAVQIPLLKQVLDALGLMRVEKEGYEADDLIGTVSRLCSERGDECVIVTGDKDSFQLIGGGTRVLHVKTRMGQTETVNYTSERFFEEYGFTPPRMVDLKALMGDASDNIPGVAGVGEKTAMDLIQRFDTVQRIYDGLDTLDIKDSVRKKLAAGTDSAKMSFELATIDTAVPLDFDAGAARWDGKPRPELYDIFLRLGFTKFIEKYKLTPPEGAQEATVFTGECTMTRLTDNASAEAVSERLRALAGPVFYWCLPELDFVAVEAGQEDKGEAYILRRDGFEGGYNAALGALFAPEIKKAGHNVKDLQRALLERGLSPEGWVFDTALAAYLLDATADSYDIDRLCMKYCGFEPYRAQRSGDGQMSLLDEEDVSAAQEDAERASLCSSIGCLYDVFEKKLKEYGMERLYYDIELPLCQVLAEMEREGFLVDRQALYDFGESLTGSIEALEQSIHARAGGAFNINSPKQLGTVLFEKLMLPAGKKTKTGWSTSADVLDKLRGKDPIIEEILDYRMLTKLKSTYADGLLKVIGPDGRIHTSFQMTVTATGRLSSTEPNLQNIPIRKELGAQIRRMFVAGEGNVLVDADYSQIELRLLAHISRDGDMINAFKSGEDIHAVTASQVFNLPLDQVTSVHRSRAKAVNFGIVYGISAWSLAQDIGVLPAEAKEYMDAYLSKYHGVREYMKSIVEQARRDGYVATLYGRRRALPELKSSNFATRSFGERVALNMPIQGTAADVIKLAMVNVHRRLKSEGLRSRLILQVHDELIAECPAGEAERVRELIKQEMESAADFSVTLTAQAGAGQSWAQAH
ncbi:MAG: DNA polymerase I [Butyricicoccus sp.]|nr:DNA polymerase I [Butyricicoccus sp.]